MKLKNLNLQKLYYLQDLYDIAYSSDSNSVKIRKVKNYLKNNRGFSTVLINNLLEMVYLCLDDKNWTVLYINKACKSLTGYKESELAFNSILSYEDIIYPEDKNHVREKVLNGIKKNKKYSLSYRIVTKSGKVKWVYEIGQSVATLKNGLHLLEGYITDITHIKNLSEALNVEKEQLKKTNFLINLILEKLPIGIATNRISDGKVLFINKAFSKIYGWPTDELIDIETFFNKVYPEKDYREKIKKMVLEGIASKNPAKMRWNDIRITKKNGTIGYVNAVNIPVYTQDLMVSTVIDFTDQHNYIKKITDLFDQTIKLMANLVEIKDPYTYNHQSKVSKLSIAIAKEMGLPDEKVKAIKYASLIHDIGKINIPPSILNKPGELSYIESKLLETHPENSYKIVKDIAFPWPIKEIILQHHERIDGSGYPKGIKNNEILLEAKIIAVADVIEAMASHRPYRPTLGIEKALEEISKNSGKLYDEKVCSICMKLFKKRNFIL